MYYVNKEQIGLRMNVIPSIAEAAEWLAAKASPWGRVEVFAYERVLHLAIETVTDIGSLLIDAFMMRDASSYEDIIEILHGERVFDAEWYAPLQRLVKLRRPLVQDYAELPRGDDSLFPVAEIPAMLHAFADSANRFIKASEF